MIRDLNRPWTLEAGDVPSPTQYLAVAAVVWCVIGLAGWGAFALVQIAMALS